MWREINSPHSKLPVQPRSSEHQDIVRNSVAANRGQSSDDNDHLQDVLNNDTEPAVTPGHQVLITPRTRDRDLNFLALSDTDTVDCYTVPSPVYPSSSLPRPGPSSMKRRSRDQMTRHQIINLYCSSSEERER